MRMKSVVFYDSQFGNTRQLAEAIAAELRAVGSVQIENARSETLSLPPDLDLLVVGGPTQVHQVSPPLRAQLDTMAKHSLHGVQAATFDTRVHGPRLLTGAASTGIAKRLKQKGARLVVEPESFLVQGTEGPLVEGELERVHVWARGILAKSASGAASSVTV
jgi:flavodoxin